MSNSETHRLTFLDTNRGDSRKISRQLDRQAQGFIQDRLFEPLSLYVRYVAISIRAQMQYRGSFIMLTFGAFVVSACEFAGILVLFGSFHALGEWGLAEVALFYGLINTAFPLAEAVGRGFDCFSGMVKNGGFDRILLRPRSAAFQIAAKEVQLLRIGKFTQGLMVLVWAMSALELEWNAVRILLLTVTILGGASLFYGLFVIQATISFWTTETLELFNAVTYGGCETAQYPLAIYRPWFRKFFTFVIPLACITYFPALGLLGREDAVMGSPEWFHWLAPCFGVVFLAVSMLFWQVGVRKYCSTGS